MWITEQKLRKLITEIVAKREPVLVDAKVIKVHKIKEERYYGGYTPTLVKTTYTLIEWPDGTRTNRRGRLGNEGDTFKMEKNDGE